MNVYEFSEIAEQMADTCNAKFWHKVPLSVPGYALLVMGPVKAVQMEEEAIDLILHLVSGFVKTA